jgi:hypothetical protein
MEEHDEHLRIVSPTYAGPHASDGPANSSRSPGRTALRWDQSLIAEGAAIFATEVGTAPTGRYQMQAASAVVHVEAD